MKNNSKNLQDFKQNANYIRSETIRNKRIKITKIKKHAYVKKLYKIKANNYLTKE